MNKVLKKKEKLLSYKCSQANSENMCPPFKKKKKRE